MTDYTPEYEIKPRETPAQAIERMLKEAGCEFVTVCPARYAEGADREAYTVKPKQSKGAKGD